jgi:hypothetical protein
MVTVVVFAAVLLPVSVVPFWKLFPRLQFNKWLALVMLVPYVNVIFLYYVAFSKPKSNR